MNEHIIVIGGGGTGAALAYDLVTRGFQVTLVERGELFSGATGRHHGLLHSGARYAVHDPEAARECFQENQILKRIAPFAIEPNDGLFLATEEEDLRYLESFLEGCESCSIPTRLLEPAEIHKAEPEVTPEAKKAVQIPDATFDPFRLPLSFLASAVAEGVRVRRFCEVTGFIQRGDTIEGVRIIDRRRGAKETLGGDVVVNAAGAWAGSVANLAGLSIPLKPGPGVMVAVEGRLTDMVLNHLHPPTEGDIVVPQRKSTIVGTSLWLADHPDDDEAPMDHVQRMIELSSKLVPRVASAKIRAFWSASRPLLDNPSFHDDPQQISRTFRCFDHGERDGRPGFLSLIGGKATTLRAMAETTADHICTILRREELSCRTKHALLRPHREYFQLPRPRGME